VNSITRVLLIAPDYPPARGGIQYLLRGLVRHADRVLYRIVAFGETDEVTDEDLVRTRRVRTRAPHSRAIATLNATAVAESRRFRPDAVLSGHIVTAPAARLIQAPYVQYLYAKEMAHRPRLTAFAARHASATIVLGEHGRALALGSGACAARIHPIPPGIDVPNPPTSTPRKRPPEIVTVARLEDRYKGFDVLIRALPLVRSRVPDARLTFVGSGSLRPGLEALARANHCADGLRCLGAVSDEARDAVLAGAAVFAMPSRVPRGSGGEGFGIVYLEAGGHGTPVVAADEGGSVDAVVDGETGLLVRPDSHLAVSEAITRLLLDRELSARLGAGGRRWAEGFAWPNVVRKVEDVLIAAADRGR
jgi:phosphatidylinositol alpha-1,6-mannosyltransferase